MKYFCYLLVLITSGLYSQNKDLKFYQFGASKLQKEPKAVWCFMNYSDCQSCLGLTMAYISNFEKNSIPYYIIWKSDKLEQKDQIEDFEFLFGHDKIKRMILFSTYPKQLQYRPKFSIAVYNSRNKNLEFKGVDLTKSDFENINGLFNSSNVNEDINKNLLLDSIPDIKINEINVNANWLTSISKINERAFFLDTCKEFFFLQSFSGKLFRYNSNINEEILCLDPKIFVNQNYDKLVKVFLDCNPDFEINADSLIINKQLLDTSSYIKKFGWVVSNRFIFTDNPHKVGLAINFTFCRDTKGGVVLEQGCAVAFISLDENKDIEVFSYPIFNEFGTPIMNYSSTLHDNSKQVAVNLYNSSTNEGKVFLPAIMKLVKSSKEENIFTFFNQNSLVQSSQGILCMYGNNWQIRDTTIIFNPQFKKIFYLNKDLKLINEIPLPIDDLSYTGFLYKNSPLVLHYLTTDEVKEIQIFWYSKNKWVSGNNYKVNDNNTLIGYYIEGDKLMRIGNGKNGKIEFKTMGKLGL